MMKRWMTGICALVLAMTVFAMPVLAEETPCGRTFTDTNGDSICDNRTEAPQGNGRRCRFWRTAAEMATQPCQGAGYVDEDGNGICDKRGSGYADENNDGICDNRSSGNGHSNNRGRRRGQNR